MILQSIDLSRLSFKPGWNYSDIDDHTKDYAVNSNISSSVMKSGYDASFISTEITKEESILLSNLIIAIDSNRLKFSLVLNKGMLEPLNILSKVTEKFNIELALFGNCGTVHSKFCMVDVMLKNFYLDLALDYNSIDTIDELEIEICYSKIIHMNGVEIKIKH